MTEFTWEELQGAIVDHTAPLGAGGYGTVYRGRLRGGTQVAIKVLKADSQQGQREFDREVAILGALHHEHLLPLLGSCSERHALVYPLMQGSLEQRLQLAGPAATAAAAQATSDASTAGPLPWHDRVRICHEVVLGLMWLHTQDPPILHMDLKTTNILLDRFGTAKVGDVGLARLKSDSNDTASYIKSRVLRGTPAYMAPEYLQKGQCGAFTDVYALGVMMCEMLTSRSARDAVSALEDVFDDISTANEEGANAKLQLMLDPAAGWPIATAVMFAAMAAACLQPCRRRPDLQQALQPALEAMLAAAAAPAPAQQSRCAGQQQVVSAHQALPAAFANPDSSLMISVPQSPVECPICHDTLADPISTPGGVIFCWPCITDWLSNGTCPSTRQPLSVQQLAPNYALAGLLDSMGRLQLQQLQVKPSAPLVQSTAQPSVAASKAPATPAPVAVPIGTPAPAPAAAMPFVTDQPKPSWQQKLAAAKARPSDAAAWETFGLCFQGCTEIRLGGTKIADSLMTTALAQHAARHWLNLQRLDLYSSSIGDAGAIALAQHAAQHWPNLQTLNLGDNRIGAAGATALAQHAAQHWTNLQALGLNVNSIGAAGATALAQHAAQHWTKLQQLYMNGNGIGAAGAAALAQHAAQHWHNLQELNLGDNNIDDAGVIALAQHAAAHWPSLRALGLDVNSIGAAGATALAQHAAQHWTKLQQLYLCGNTIGDASATALAQHAAAHWPSLQTLGLDVNSIGAAGATALAQHAAQHWPKLQMLGLGDNSIGAAGATALAQQAAAHWPNLQTLYMNGNGIGAAGATALAQHAASHWHNLQELNLGDNNIGDAGVIALAQRAAQHWPNLQELGLDHNSIGAAGATALAQHAARHWPRLMKLEFSGNTINFADWEAMQAWARRNHQANRTLLNGSFSEVGSIRRYSPP